MMPEAPLHSSRRGRRAAATRREVLALVMHRYLRGLRVDVQAIALELGLGLASIAEPRETGSSSMR